MWAMSVVAAYWTEIAVKPPRTVAKPLWTYTTVLGLGSLAMA